MWGRNVVTGYAATRGLARDMALSKVDFPALGNPMRPTWAIVRSSKEKNYHRANSVIIDFASAEGNANTFIRCQNGLHF